MKLANVFCAFGISNLQMNMFSAESSICDVTSGRMLSKWWISHRCRLIIVFAASCIKRMSTYERQRCFLSILNLKEHLLKAFQLPPILPFLCSKERGKRSGRGYRIRLSLKSWVETDSETMFNWWDFGDIIRYVRYQYMSFPMAQYQTFMSFLFKVILCTEARLEDCQIKNFFTI